MTLVKQPTMPSAATIHQLTRGFWSPLAPSRAPPVRKNRRTTRNPEQAPASMPAHQSPYPEVHPGCRGCRPDVGCTHVSATRIKRDVECSRGAEVRKWLVCNRNAPNSPVLDRAPARFLAHSKTPIFGGSVPVELRVANSPPTKDCAQPAAMGYCMTTDHDTRVSMSPQPPQDGRWAIFAPASYKNMVLGYPELTPAGSWPRPKKGLWLWELGV
jgi:hypothetical protein